MTTLDRAAGDRAETEPPLDDEQLDRPGPAAYALEVETSVFEVKDRTLRDARPGDEARTHR